MARHVKTATRKYKRRKKQREPGFISRKELKHLKFVSDLHSAANTAYYAQERKTMDSATKRAVREATLHMVALMLGESFQVSVPSMEDVQAMVLDVKGPMAVLKVEKLNNIVADYPCTRRCTGANGICSDPLHALAKRMQEILDTTDVARLVPT
jgi:hypothetical protein